MVGWGNFGGAAPGRLAPPQPPAFTPLLQIMCRLMMVVSFVAGGLAVFLMWGLYPAKARGSCGG